MCVKRMPLFLWTVYQPNTKYRRPLGRMLIALLALLILNTSIDTPDPADTFRWDGEDYVEDLSYNDIESFYELVTEEMLDMDNQVPEHDEDSGDTDKQGKTLQYWITNELPVLQLKTTETKQRIYPLLHYTVHPRYGDVSSPPPDEKCA